MRNSYAQSRTFYAQGLSTDIMLNVSKELAIKSSYPLPYYYYFLVFI